MWLLMTLSATVRLLAPRQERGEVKRIAVALGRLGPAAEVVLPPHVLREALHPFVHAGHLAAVAQCQQLLLRAAIEGEALEGQA